MNLQHWRDRSPLLTDLSDTSFAFLESIAYEISVGKDETLFRVGSTADHLYLVTGGTVALRITGPSGPPVTLQTLGEGSLVGLSWRLPPYRWQWTCQTVVDSTLAAFDANDLLTECERNTELDRDLWRVVAQESSKRLHNVRLQLLDLFGSG